MESEMAPSSEKAPLLYSYWDPTREDTAAVAVNYRTDGCAIVFRTYKQNDVEDGFPDALPRDFQIFSRQQISQLFVPIKNTNRENQHC